MQTFESIVRTSRFWAAVFVPPLAFFILVQWAAARTESASHEVWLVLGLVGLAQALPLAALAWTLCSVAAYSVRPRTLVVHRVVGDREYPLSELRGAPALRRGVVEVQIRRKQFRLRVAEPESCLAALVAASSASHAEVGA